MIKALLIDDDLELSNLMQAVLGKYNIDLDTASSPEAGFRALEKQAYEVLLLDIMLPEMDGLQVCRTIRASSAQYRDLPIIMLTARTDLTDIVAGLEIGADDYIKKPFEPRELVARITAVLRRFDPSGTLDTKAPSPETQTQASRQCQLLLDDNILTIDSKRAQLFVNGTRLPIASMEFELIKTMALSPGAIYNRSELLKHIHTVDVLYTRSIDALIYRLRSKIEQAGVNANFIRTVRGRGYALIGTLLPLGLDPTLALCL